jgi:hypothetical protein
MSDGTARGEERISGWRRGMLLVLGGVLIAAAWPIGFILAVISGGGHGSPFGHSVVENVFGAAMLAVPVLMLALGIAFIAASSLRRLRIAAALGLLIPIDLAVIAAAVWQMDQPPPPVILPPADPHAVIPAAPAVQPVLAVAACSPDKRTCTTVPMPRDNSAAGR